MGFKEEKIIRELVKQMSSGLHQQIKPYLPRVYKFKDIDINYPAPVAFHEKRARSYSSSSDDSRVSPWIIMPEMLIGLPSSLSSSTSDAEEISIENVTMGIENSNQKKKKEIQTENKSDLKNE